MDKIKQPIYNFIVERLKNKEIEVVHVKSQRTKNEWFRFFLKNIKTNETLIFTLLKNDENLKNEWYKKTHFDSSMNKKRKEEILKETPIETAISEYFKQKFIINNIEYLLRFS